MVLFLPTTQSLGKVCHHDIQNWNQRLKKHLSPLKNDAETQGNGGTSQTHPSTKEHYWSLVAICCMHTWHVAGAICWLCSLYTSFDITINRNVTIVVSCCFIINYTHIYIIYLSIYLYDIYTYIYIYTRMLHACIYHIFKDQLMSIYWLQDGYAWDLALVPV